MNPFHAKSSGTFPDAGPGEAPRSAYGIIGADDRQPVGLDTQGL